MINLLNGLSKAIGKNLVTYTAMPTLYTPIIYFLFLLSILSFFLQQEFCLVFHVIESATPHFILVFFSHRSLSEVFAFGKIFLWLYFILMLLAAITPEKKSEQNKFEKNQYFFVAAYLFVYYLGAILIFISIIYQNLSNWSIVRNLLLNFSDLEVLEGILLTIVCFNSLNLPIHMILKFFKSSKFKRHIKKNLS